MPRHVGQIQQTGIVYEMCAQKSVHNELLLISYGGVPTIKPQKADTPRLEW